MNRENLLNELKNIISEKLQVLQMEIDQLRADMSSDTKSTAGDKHETSRAMAQLEMEKLGAQIQDYNLQLSTLSNLQQKPATSSKVVEVGTLAKLSSGWFFIGIALGKINFEGDNVFCISIKSPLGQQLFQKQVNDSISLNGQTITVLSIE